MQAYAGITHIEIGGQNRPLKFGTNQTAKFCELRKIDLQQYSEIMQEGLSDAGNIRDLFYSALFAGAKSEKMPVDFDEYQVGDWIDEGDQEALMKKLVEAITGVAGPNGNRAQRRAKQEAGR